MSKKYSRRESGFIALVSALIISAILLLVAGSVGFSSFYSRFNILDAEFKEGSRVLADACTDELLLLIANDPLYRGSLVLSLGEGKCTISPAGFLGIHPAFAIESSYREAFTNRLISINISTVAVESLEELPSY